MEDQRRLRRCLPSQESSTLGAAGHAELNGKSYTCPKYLYGPTMSSLKGSSLRVRFRVLGISGFRVERYQARVIAEAMKLEHYNL